MQPGQNLETDEAFEVIRSCFDGLMRALAEWKDSVLQPGAVGHSVFFQPVDGTELEGYAANQLIRAVSDWDIPAQSENGAVSRYPGVCEVASGVLEATNRLNASKDALAEAVQALGLSNSSARLRSILTCLGSPRLHQLQALRKVNVLAGPGLASIGISVAKKTYSIEKLDFESSIKRLEHMRAQDVIEQIVDAGYDTVHWHAPISNHLRANVTWYHEGHRTSRMLHASLPFLVPAGHWPTKRVRFNEPRDHAERRDKHPGAVVPLPNRDGAYLRLS